jgi:hypothetical protein
VAETIAAWTTWNRLLAAGEEGCAYAVLVRGRGTDGGDVTEGWLCVYMYAGEALGKPAGREGRL